MMMSRLCLIDFMHIFQFWDLPLAKTNVCTRNYVFSVHTLYGLCRLHLKKYLPKQPSGDHMRDYTRKSAEKTKGI